MRWGARILAAVAVLAMAGCGFGIKAPAAPSVEKPAAEQQAAEGTRLALVIGVGKYRSEIGALDNPLRDAELVAGALRARGFLVTPLEDPDRRTLTTALNTFASNLEAEGKGAVGLIYFAGHGMQVNGVNYILPRDAEAPDGLTKDSSPAVVEAALSDAFLPADRLLRTLGQRENGVNILILDACRDNNLVRSIGQQKTRGAFGAPRSLADKPLEADDMLIAYATGPGEYSYDGAGANSPFATALADEINGVGTAYEVLTRVRARVRTATGGKQKPLFTGALAREFCFSACDAARPNAAPARADAGGKARSIAALNGKWDYPDNNCAAPFTYAVTADELRITGEGWASTAIVRQETDGWLNVTATAPAEVAGKTFGYKVEGSTLRIRDGTGAPTELSACR